jgi:predicted nuclease of predicted toxin-antitoxin system
VRFVIDMNLSTDWVVYLQGLGHDAVHWSSIGPQDTADEEIAAWARAEDRTILTNDLDFGTLLVSTGAAKPSVVQLRTDITLSAHVGPLVAQAIDRMEAGLVAGALVTIETGRLRIRSLAPDSED